MTLEGRRSFYGDSTVAVIRDVYDRFKRGADPGGQEAYGEGGTLVFIVRNVEALLDIAEGLQDQLKRLARIELRQDPTGYFEAVCYGQTHKLRALTKEEALTEAYVMVPVWTESWAKLAQEDIKRLIPEGSQAVRDRFEILGEDT